MSIEYDLGPNPIPLKPPPSNIHFSPLQEPYISSSFSTLPCLDWVRKSGLSWLNVLDPCLLTLAESGKKWGAFNIGSLVSHKLLHCTGAWSSKPSTYSVSHTVPQNIYLCKDLFLKMTSSMSHCIILLMKPIWRLQGPKHEPNNHEGTSNEILGTVNLKLLHLEDIGSVLSWSQ